MTIDLNYGKDLVAILTHLAICGHNWQIMTE